MKILVTGGAGYIGRVLVPYLVDKGYDVTVLDRMFLNYDDVEAELDSLGCKLIKDDTRYFDPVSIRHHDAVIDLAALSNDPAGELDPLKTWDINYIGRSRVGRLSKKVGVKKYIVASSCSVYGFRKDIANEESPTNPLTTYAEANIAIEKDNLALADSNFTSSALRFATAFGYSKRMRFDIAINAMTLQLFKTGKVKLMRDGSQYRPFVHVKDISRAIVRTLESDSDLVNGQVFNVGSQELNTRLKDLAEIIKNSISPSAEIEWYGDPDSRSYRVDFTKIREKLGYNIETDIRTGVKEIRSKLENGELDDYPETHTMEQYKKILKNKLKEFSLDKGELLL